MGPDWPAIYLLSTNLTPSELHALEDQIPSLTWDIGEAELVLGKISKRERALFELRKLKLRTEELEVSAAAGDVGGVGGGGGDERDERDEGGERAPKRRRVAGDAFVSGHDSVGDGDGGVGESVGVVRVLRLSWLTDSLEAGAQLPMDDYLLYSGKKLKLAAPEAGVQQRGQNQDQNQGQDLGQDQNRNQDQSQNQDQDQSQSQNQRRTVPSPNASRWAQRRSGQRQRPGGTQSQAPTLTHETTSEHDMPLPPVPDFLQTTYSCQRPTPANPPNADFIEELKKVRTLRILQADHVGVRAYSTSVAAVSAYPFALQTLAGRPALSPIHRVRNTR